MSFFCDNMISGISNQGRGEKENNDKHTVERNTVWHRS